MPGEATVWVTAAYALVIVGVVLYAGLVGRQRVTGLKRGRVPAASPESGDDPSKPNPPDGDERAAQL